MKTQFALNSKSIPWDILLVNSFYKEKFIIHPLDHKAIIIDIWNN